MSPKIALWIGFTILSSTWYVLDPEAHGTVSKAFAQADSVQQIEYIVAAETPEQIMMTAMN